MTVQDIINELNDHGFTDESTTAKVRVIQHTIWDIENRQPWSWLEKTATLDYDGTTDVPTDFPTDFRDALALKDMTTSRRVRYVRLEEFEDMVGTAYTQTGNPQVYYFEADTLKVWPVPPAGYQLKLRYIRTSTAVADVSPENAISLPPRFHRLISYGSLWRLYDMEDDPELATRFETHYENGLTQMREAMEARQYDRPDHIVMADPDDYADESWGWGWYDN